MKVRIKFAKYGVLRYIGHLDVMRYFQKAMRRADVDIKYSQGFNPHQIMSFAQPLGLGITSEGEYVDIEVDKTLTSQEMVDKLNAVMVEGIRILSYRELPDTAKNGMSVIAGADYYIFFDNKEDLPFDLKKTWDAFIHQESIFITKTTKTKEEEMDIRPWIFESEATDSELYLQLSCGSSVNLKPEVVCEALFAFAKEEFNKDMISMHRIELYARNEEGNFVSLEDMATPIDMPN